MPRHNQRHHPTTSISPKIDHDVLPPPEQRQRQRQRCSPSPVRATVASSSSAYTDAQSAVSLAYPVIGSTTATTPIVVQDGNRRFSDRSDGTGLTEMKGPSGTRGRDSRLMNKCELVVVVSVCLEGRSVCSYLYGSCFLNVVLSFYYFQVKSMN